MKKSLKIFNMLGNYRHLWYLIEYARGLVLDKQKFVIQNHIDQSPCIKHHQSTCNQLFSVINIKSLLQH